MGWADADKAHEYLHRVGGLAPRLAGEAVLVELLPARVDRVADLVLEERPSVTEVVALDASPPTLSRARERFRDDDRVSVLEHDLRDDLGALGEFDLVVSGFAIHHLDDVRKRGLFGEIADRLRPGGMFANLEVVASATPELHAQFRNAIGRVADDPEDQLADVESQLTWMRAAGLQQVDCLWRWRGFALLVGQSSS
jgi:tRNA (cmo5U34)-methyltransferase